MSTPALPSSDFVELVAELRELEERARALGFVVLAGEISKFRVAVNYNRATLDSRGVQDVAKT